MNKAAIEKMRDEARKLMAGIFGDFHTRRSVSAKIGEWKKSMNMPVEDYLQEKLLIENFNAQGGNNGKLFSILVQDSLEAQGQLPIKAFYNDVEIEGISALCSLSQGDQNSLKNFVKSTVPGADRLDIGFVQGRRAAIISWAIEFGYGRAANIIEPFGRSIDQLFWIVGSRPYRHSSVNQAVKFNKGTMIIKLPSIFGKGITNEDLAEISRTMGDMPVLIDITYSEIGRRGRFSGVQEVRGNSVMIYGLPGTVGYPWETAAIIGEADTVERTLKRFYSIWGVMASIFPSPSNDISPAMNMLAERVKELHSFSGELISVPDYGPFAIVGKSAGNLPAWAKAVDVSYYGDFKGMYVVNLLK